MAPPRGLKKILCETQGCKLTGTGKFKSFQRLHQGVPHGCRLRGLHKALEKHIYSEGSLPETAIRASGRRPGGHWGGPNGGRKRGARVDAQISRIINMGPSAEKKLHVYNLTKSAFAALQMAGLTPVYAQRATCRGSLGTAADLIVWDEAEQKLGIVEVKCGYDKARDAPAKRGGRICRLQSPLEGAKDTTRNRHMAQLLATCQMTANEEGLFARLASLGIQNDIKGVLLYINDDGAEITVLDHWWQSRGGALVTKMSGKAR